MSTLVEVCIIVITAFIVLFISFLIPMLVKIGRAANEVGKLAEMIRYHIAPVSHDLAVIFSKTKDISESVGRQVYQIEGTVKKFKTYERIFDEKVGQPIIDLIALLSGIMKGISTFLQHVRK